MSKKRMITRLLSVATAVTVGLSFCACGATPEEPKENRREEAEQKDTEKERKDAEKASISLEGEYKPASFEQRDINSDTIRWMCSAYAIYSAYNDKSLEVVGGLAGDDREWYREEVKEALAGGWGIYDRKDVEDTLEDLLEEGHRKQYKEAVSELKKAEILELSSGEAMVEIAGYDPCRRKRSASIRLHMKHIRNMAKTALTVGITVGRFRYWEIVIRQSTSIWKSAWICHFRSRRNCRKHTKIGMAWLKVIFMDIRSGKGNGRMIMTARNAGRFMRN